MPESENSSCTSALNDYLTKVLRMYARDLRNSYAKDKDLKKLDKKVEEFMTNIYNILSVSLGTPPTVIDFEARDEKKKFISYKNITPQEFVKKHIGLNLDDYISLINAPTKDKPYYKSYTVDFLGNVTELDHVKYVNCLLYTSPSPRD